jgi:hypothetical protein
MGIAAKLARESVSAGHAKVALPGAVRLYRATFKKLMVTL